MLKRATPLYVVVAFSLPSSSVVKIPFTAKVPSIIDTIPLPVLVVRILSALFGKVSVPFPE
jgi:hypothetical protein